MSSDNDMPALSDDGDSDWDEIEETIPVKCLFCENILSNTTLAAEHLTQQHDFDLVFLKKKYDMDCYSYIKMINYIQKLKPKPEELLKSEKPIWDDELYLTPTIIDDPWMMFDFDFLVMDRKQEFYEGSIDNSSDIEKIEVPAWKYEEMVNAIVHLKREIDEKEIYIKMAVEDINKMKSVTQNIIENISSTAEYKSEGAANVGNLEMQLDEGYFNSYAHFGIHYEMLSDNIRTESYRDAILKNSSSFNGCRVLDVGCGTGILSMFSAKAGATEVVGVDMSEIIYHAMDIAHENGLDKTITLIKGRLEDIEIPTKQVDIIVSEWMGYFLLFEGMLDSVIYARDKYLKPGGLLLPNRCNISIVGSGDLDDYKNYISFWNDVHGFKMSCMKKNVLKEANLDIARKEHLITDPYIINNIDLETCTTDCVNFSCDFTLKANRNGHFTSLVGYFDIFFDLVNPIKFSTGPYSEPTHWKQTIFNLKEPELVEEGQEITGKFTCKRDPMNVRGLSIALLIFGQNYEYRL